MQARRLAQTHKHTYAHTTTAGPAPSSLHKDCIYPLKCKVCVPSHPSGDGIVGLASGESCITVRTLVKNLPPVKVNPLPPQDHVIFD